MSERLTELLTHRLVRHHGRPAAPDFVQQALLAAALLALVFRLIGPFIVMRQMSFAVHGSSELSLTGRLRAAGRFQYRDRLARSAAPWRRCCSVSGDSVRANGIRRSVWCSRSGWGWRCCSFHLYPAALAPASPADPARSSGWVLGAGAACGGRRTCGAVLTMCYRRCVRPVDPEVAAAAVFPYARGSCRGAGRGDRRARRSRSSVRCGDVAVITPAAPAAVRGFVSPSATIAASWCRRDLRGRRHLLSLGAGGARFGPSPHLVRDLPGVLARRQRNGVSTSG